MDQRTFDRLARFFATAASRRTSLRLLLVGVAAGMTADAAAKRTHRQKHGARRNEESKSKRPGPVSAQAADCLSPGHGANMNGCNFNNQNFAGANLSSSSMRGTSFRGANLCGADLSSSQLKDADFRGFAAPGNVTNLTRADLSSSGCVGTKFNSRTIFCQTITCNGTVRNDGCPGGVNPGSVCCGDGDCPGTTTCLPSGVCCFANGTNVGDQPSTVCCSGIKCAADSGPNANECAPSQLTCALSECAPNGTNIGDQPASACCSGVKCAAGSGANANTCVANVIACTLDACALNGMNVGDQPDSACCSGIKCAADSGPNANTCVPSLLTCTLAEA